MAIEIHLIMGCEQADGWAPHPSRQVLGVIRLRDDRANPITEVN